jgi:hypothetical protein
MTARLRLPYPGLRAFTREESDLFFGRDGCVDTMVNRFAATRFLAVLGPSGSGKSSLVRTGFQDALDLGLHPWAGSKWKVADLHPGGQPMRNLAIALLGIRSGQEADETDVQLLTAYLEHGPRSILEWVSGGNLESETNLLVMVDQFEELFRYSDYAQREAAEAFVALLLESAAAPGVPIHIVITMRSEYLGACALIAGLAERINVGMYLTPRMGREECRDAIEGPASVIGFKVEPALVNRLLNDLGRFAPWETGEIAGQAERLSRQADQLPVMQHVLNRLFVRALEDAGSPVTLKLVDYERIGGLSGALDAHGAEVIAALGLARTPQIEAIFRALVTGTSIALAVRRPCRMTELIELAGADNHAVAAIVDAFRAPGCNFVRTSRHSLDHEDVIVDISHESLIRQWTPLREWLSKEWRDGAAWGRIVAAEEHYRLGEGGLLTGLDLQNLSSWYQSVRPTPAWTERHGNNFDLAVSFLEASQETETDKAETEVQRIVRERARLRAYIVGLAAALLISIGLGAYSHREWNKAKEESQREKIAEEKATNAETLAKAKAEEARANAEESRTNALKSATFIEDLSDTLYSDERSDLVGTSGLRSQLMEKFLPYEAELSRQNTDAFKPEARIRNDYRQALSFSSMGQAQKAMDSYRAAYEDGLRTIQSLPAETPQDEPLMTSFLQDAYYYAWYLLDIGEKERGGAVIKVVKDVQNRCRCRDESIDYIMAEAGFENLESRYEFDNHQLELSRRHLENAVALADRAVKSPNSGLAAKSLASVMLQNKYIDAKEPERAELVSQICGLAEKMNQNGPMNKRSINARVDCLVDQSAESSRAKDSSAAREEMQKALDLANSALTFDPSDPDLLLMSAGIENSLGDLYYGTGHESVVYQHRIAAKDRLVRALTGRTPVQANATQLRTIFDNCSRATFPNMDQELKFYREIFQAMATTLNAFPKSPSFAYIAGKASVRIGEILKENKQSQKEAEEYLSKAVMWFDRSGMIADLSTYSQEFDTYCAAYLQRALLYSSMNRAKDVLADTRHMRLTCTPALERYPWDYYLRTRLIIADSLEGAVLVDLKRYKEAVLQLNHASHWGQAYASGVLARLYQQGLGVEKDEKRANEFEALSKDQTVATFSLPVDFGSNEEPVSFHVWQWPPEYTRQFPGIDDQVRLYKESSNATVNPQKAQVIRKIQAIAIRNNYSFPRLCSPEDYAGGIEERYQELVKDKNRVEAERFEKEMVDAVELLVIVLQSEPANRAAWGTYLNHGDHLLATDKVQARVAFVRSAEFAELLPQDKPGDLISRIESFDRLANLDGKTGESEGSNVWHTKSETTHKSLRTLATKTWDRSHDDQELLDGGRYLIILAKDDSGAGDQPMAREDSAHAYKLLKQVRDDTPEGAFGRFDYFDQLGNAFLTNGNPSEARETYLDAATSGERYIAMRLETPARVAKLDPLPREDLYRFYGSVSYLYVEAGRFDKGMAAAESGLKLQPDAAWIEANLAHALLLTGKRDEAIKHYMNARKGTLGGRTVTEATKDDFDHLQKLGFSDPQMPAILSQMAQH